jgi:hypothetical protein
MPHRKSLFAALFLVLAIVVAAVAATEPRDRRRRPRETPRRAARDRPPRSERIPPRAHAGVVRARDRAGRRLHRAGSRLNEGPRPRRSSRERHLRDDGRRGTSGVREPPDDQGRRRRHDHRLVHRGLHPRRAEDAVREGAPAGPESEQHVFDRQYRSRPSRRSSISPSGTTWGSIPRRSIRRTTSSCPATRARTPISPGPPASPRSPATPTASGRTRTSSSRATRRTTYSRPRLSSATHTASASSSIPGRSGARTRSSRRSFRQGNTAHPLYLAAPGNLPGELALFYKLGVDGVFSDNPDVAVATRADVFDD